MERTADSCDYLEHSHILKIFIYLHIYSVVDYKIITRVKKANNDITGTLQGSTTTYNLQKTLSSQKTKKRDLDMLVTFSSSPISRLSSNRFRYVRKFNLTWDLATLGYNLNLPILLLVSGTPKNSFGSIENFLAIILNNMIRKYHRNYYGLNACNRALNMHLFSNFLCAF